jgi:hypothetical protein
MKTIKYRPCFTSEIISHLYSLCRNNICDKSIEALAVLAPFKAKIENNGISPAYTINKKESLVDSLGIENDEEYALLAPNEKRKKAYAKWSLNPDSCNSFELVLVRDYRYFNQLMSPEEVEQYDADTNAMLVRTGLLQPGDIN